MGGKKIVIFVIFHAENVKFGLIFNTCNYSWANLSLLSRNKRFGPQFRSTQFRATILVL